ncbi:MAG TPA: DHHA1 domain-containing protein, partial [candidate division Zixibacteria bacterium]|nr:DHHA1 domain-containing protein [candidate division Zixibacteria bacterium]
EAGANPQEICDQIYFNMSPSTIRLIGKVLNGIRFFDSEQICVITLTRQMLEESGAKDSDSEGLVDYTLFTRGVRAGVMLKEIEPGLTKASLRSRNNINVSTIAAQFGGGGHFNASGCTLNLGLDDARNELVKILSEVIDEQDG